jgi:hypothetical protein
MPSHDVISGSSSLAPHSTISVYTGVLCIFTNPKYLASQQLSPGIHNSQLLDYAGRLIPAPLAPTEVQEPSAYHASALRGFDLPSSPGVAILLGVTVYLGGPSMFLLFRRRRHHDNDGHRAARLTPTPMPNLTREIARRSHV